MKLCEIAGMPKARSLNDLLATIKNGRLTKDGSDLQNVTYLDYADKDLISLKGSPNKITGKFYCIGNQLTSLEGCPQIISKHFSCTNNFLTSLFGGPKEVGGDFSCSFNKLTSLEGCPSETGGGFYCINNQLTSLIGCPKKIEGSLHCSGNKLKSLEGIHKCLEEMVGVFYTRGNPIKSHVLGLLKIRGCVNVEIDNGEVQDILNKYLPLGDLFDCQEELIEAGFEEYAQL